MRWMSLSQRQGTWAVQQQPEGKAACAAQHKPALGLLRLTALWITNSWVYKGLLVRITMHILQSYTHAVFLQKDDVLLTRMYTSLCKFNIFVLKAPTLTAAVLPWGEHRSPHEPHTQLTKTQLPPSFLLSSICVSLNT